MGDQLGSISSVNIGYYGDAYFKDRGVDDKGNPNPAFSYWDPTHPIVTSVTGVDSATTAARWRCGR
jgi:hypothetical protein